MATEPAAHLAVEVDLEHHVRILFGVVEPVGPLTPRDAPPVTPRAACLAQLIFSSPTGCRQQGAVR